MFTVRLSIVGTALFCTMSAVAGQSPPDEGGQVKAIPPSPTSEYAPPEFRYVSASNLPHEATSEASTELPGSSGTQPPTSTPPTSSPSPEPGAIPIPTVPRPLPSYPATGVAHNKPSVSPLVSFALPAIATNSFRS
jgi:hypothetical protein